LEKKKLNHNLRSNLAQDEFINALQKLCEKYQDSVFPNLNHQKENQEQLYEIIDQGKD